MHSSPDIVGHFGFWGWRPKTWKHPIGMSGARTTFYVLRIWSFHLELNPQGLDDFTSARYLHSVIVCDLTMILAILWMLVTSLVLVVLDQCHAFVAHSSSTNWNEVPGGTTGRWSSTLSVSTRLFSTFLSQPIEQDKYMALLQWLQDNGAEINDKIEIRESSQGDGYGAFVKDHMSEGELLFEIPRNLCLTIQDATDDKDCGELFSKLIDKAGPGGNTVAMAGYLAKEYLISLEIDGSDDDDDDDSAESSRWGPYFQTLPWKRGVNNQEHVLFWEDERVETLLDGSLCYREATSLREEVALAIRVLGPMVSKPIRVARGEETSSGFRFPWQIKEQSSVPDDRGSSPDGLAEAVRGAFVCLLTRSFQDGDGDEEKLVPLLDMLQHSETPNVRHAMRTADGAVEVRARCNIEAGSELWNQYRSEEEESMPYSRFFTR
jgi:hypothetical protein